jgi:predicted HD superfamily hydrolase involved in NAD metabolism
MTEAPIDLKASVERELGGEILAHSRRTAIVARELALAHGVDPDRAELAAIVHDIADRYSDVELLVLAERYEIPISLTEARVPKLLHGPVGAEILRYNFAITDDELLDAVRDHVCGGPHMGKLAKVLFVADKIEPERDRHYHGLDAVRQLATEDLDRAMLRLYAWRVDQLFEADRPVHERLVMSRNRLLDAVRARDFAHGDSITSVDYY